MKEVQNISLEQLVINILVKRDNSYYWWLQNRRIDWVQVWMGGWLDNWRN